MGKKRVLKQTEEEVLKQTVAQEKSELKVKVPQGGARVGKFNHARVCIQSTYNNTIVTITDAQGNVIGWNSAGASGFKGPRKATPFAASRVVELLIEKIKQP